jgi:hypothetical protein
MEFETQENIEPVETVENLGAESQNEQPVETQDYQPNFKFRVDEKEFEFDDRIRPLITDKESEEYFRDIYTKAHGLELVKQRAEEHKKKYQETSSQYGDLRNQFDHVQNTLQKINALKGDDFGTFQKVWEIPDAAILRRASEILGTHDNPEARDRVEKGYRDRIEMLQYEDRINREGQVSQAMQRQLHEMKMDRALTDPEIQRFSKEYDRRVGQQGAFIEEVNRLGTIEFHQGRYLDPQVAVSQAFQRLSKLVPVTETQPASSQRKVTEQAPKAPLPNMGSGRSGSAVKKKISSIADLRKLAQQMES